MLINCICGEKTFEVDDHEIPHDGRQVKCGACSKEWFYNPKDSKLESNDLVLKPTLKDEDIPNSAEDIISQAEQSKKNIFDDFDEKKIDIEKVNKKILSSQEQIDQRHVRNIKFFIYLVIIAFFAGSVFLVPYKEAVIIKYPQLTNWLNIMTPVYEYISSLYFSLLQKIN